MRPRTYYPEKKYESYHPRIPTELKKKIGKLLLLLISVEIGHVFKKYS